MTWQGYVSIIIILIQFSICTHQGNGTPDYLCISHSCWSSLMVYHYNLRSTSLNNQFSNITERYKHMYHCTYSICCLEIVWPIYQVLSYIPNITRFETSRLYHFVIETNNQGKSCSFQNKILCYRHTFAFNVLTSSIPYLFILNINNNSMEKCYYCHVVALL